MIGERFVRHLKPAPPRSSPRLHLFMQFVDKQIQSSIARSSHITPNGYGSRLLTYIVKLADMKTILNADLTSESFQSYLISILKDLEKPIDVRKGKHTTGKLFIQSRTSCFELMTASRRQNPLEEIPFDKPYDHSDWKALRPMRIADMGTADLRYQTHTDYLVYTRKGPTHVIYTLDCFALVCKFVAYYQSLNSVENIDQCLLDFIHTEVVVPTLLYDNLALWLRNTYKQQFFSASPLERHTSTIWETVNIDSLGSDFSGAMLDVQRLKDDLVNHSITNRTVFSSLPMSPDGTSFTDYYRELFYTTQTPNEQPFVWVDCIKHLTWQETILLIASIAPDMPDVISLKRDVVRDVRFWMMMKPWQMVHSSVPFSAMVESRVRGLHAYLKDGQ